MKQLPRLLAVAPALAGLLCAESFVITNNGTVSGASSSGRPVSAAGFSISDLGDSFVLSSMALTPAAPMNALFVAGQALYYSCALNANLIVAIYRNSGVSPIDIPGSGADAEFGSPRLALQPVRP